MERLRFESARNVYGLLGLSGYFFSIGEGTATCTDQTPNFCDLAIKLGTPAKAKEFLRVLLRINEQIARMHQAPNN